MERNVDFPQPEGPETDTYSPRPMSTDTSHSARVSSSVSSPLNTLVRCSSRMSGMPAPGSPPAALPLFRVHQAMPLSVARSFVARDDDVTNSYQLPASSFQLPA